MDIYVFFFKEKRVPVVYTLLRGDQTVHGDKRATVSTLSDLLMLNKLIMLSGNNVFFRKKEEEKEI